MDGKRERGVVYHGRECELACPECGGRLWAPDADGSRRLKCGACLMARVKIVALAATGRVRTVRHVQRD